MGKHAFRGALTAWMTLIVLRTVGTAGGSGRIASLFTDLDGLVTRALSPDVPLIRDRRVSSRGTAIVGPDGTGGDGTHGYIDPRGRYIPPSDNTVPAPSAGQVHSDAYIAPDYAPTVPTLT